MLAVSPLLSVLTVLLLSLVGLFHESFNDHVRVQVCVNLVFIFPLPGHLFEVLQGLLGGHLLVHLGGPL